MKLDIPFARNMSWKLLSEIQNLLETDYEILCILH